MACENEINVLAALWTECVYANKNRMTVTTYLNEQHLYLKDGNYKHVDYYANREVLPIVIKKVVQYLDSLEG